MSLLSFTAPVISGAGRGKAIGAPTLNLSLDAVPRELEEGIFACWIQIDGAWQMGAMHHGPRPVFKDSRSCEVYVLDQVIEKAPATVEIRVIAPVRPIMDFPSTEALMAQIEKDVVQVRSLLSAA